MKIGLNLWTLFGFSYSRKPNLAWALEVAAKIGYDGVELIYDDGVLSPTRIGFKERKRLRELSSQLGVEIPSVATGVLWKYPLSSPDEHLRELGLSYARAGLELARDLGAKVLLVVAGVAVPEAPYEKLLERSIESLKALARYAEDLGVKVGVENVWSKMLYSPLEFKKLLDEVNSEFVGAYLDVGNVVAIGYHEHWLELLKDRLLMIHVKDFDERVGGLAGFRHVGHGSIDWKRLITLLRDIGYNGYLVVECPPTFYPGLTKPRYPDDGVRAATDNLVSLRRLLSEVGACQR